MTLSERLAENVRACFAGIWIQSFEHEDALLEIARLCHGESWKMATCDIDLGLRLPGGTNSDTTDMAGSDPLAAVRALSAMADDDTPSLLVLVNFHRFLNSAEVVQAVSRQIVQGKSNRTFVVILSPVVQIPTELEKLIVCIEHEMPDRGRRIARRSGLGACARRGLRTHALRSRRSFQSFAGTAWTRRTVIDLGTQIADVDQERSALLAPRKRIIL